MQLISNDDSFGGPLWQGLPQAFAGRSNSATNESPQQVTQNVRSGPPRPPKWVSTFRPPSVMEHQKTGGNDDRKERIRTWTRCLYWVHFDSTNEHVNFAFYRSLLFPTEQHNLSLHARKIYFTQCDFWRFQPFPAAIFNLQWITNHQSPANYETTTTTKNGNNKSNSSTNPCIKKARIKQETASLLRKTLRGA